MGKPIKEFSEFLGIGDHVETWGSTSSDLKTSIKSQEQIMLDQLNRLTYDGLLRNDEKADEWRYMQNTVR